MPVRTEPTPNPNAMKFSVGKPVGGPATHLAGKDTDDPAAAEILALSGIVSVFMTADFVTVSKSADGDWDSLIPDCVEILERVYD
ncbi:MAG: NifU N-terminal domain-containing protein [Acidimicrobiia bacterium]